MLILRALVLVLGAGLTLQSMDLVFGQTTSTGSGQAYPTKTIRIVTGSVGGSSDFAARIIAQGIADPLGQSVIVNNQGREEPANVAVKAQPDGYTVLLGGSVTWLSSLMQDNVPYDALRDFSPVTLATTQPLVVVVHPSIGANSIKELIALAKAKPGTLNYGGGALSANSAALATELLKSMGGVNIVRIAYQGTGPAFNALLSGEVQLMVAPGNAVVPHIKSGKLRALAVTSAQPSALYPGLPTVAASGLPGYESGNTAAMFVPAKTPDVVIKRLNQEVVPVLNSPDVREKFFNTGVETVGNSPQELTAFIKSEVAKWGKLIKDTGLRSE